MLLVYAALRCYSYYYSGSSLLILLLRLFTTHITTQALYYSYDYSGDLRGLKMLLVFQAFRCYSYYYSGSLLLILLPRLFTTHMTTQETREASRCY
jgi:hypothetical protein